MECSKAATIFYVRGTVLYGMNHVIYLSYLIHLHCHNGSGDDLLFEEFESGLFVKVPLPFNVILSEVG